LVEETETQWGHLCIQEEKEEFANVYFGVNINYCPLPPLEWNLYFFICFCSLLCPWHLAHSTYAILICEINVSE
jgi:hypothetical protein